MMTQFNNKQIKIQAIQVHTKNQLENHKYYKKQDNKL
jgi:hypothetical protein